MTGAEDWILAGFYRLSGLMVILLALVVLTVILGPVARRYSRRLRRKRHKQYDIISSSDGLSPKQD